MATPVYGKQFIRFAETAYVPCTVAIPQFTLVTIDAITPVFAVIVFAFAEVTDETQFGFASPEEDFEVLGKFFVNALEGLLELPLDLEVEFFNDILQFLRSLLEVTVLAVEERDALVELFVFFNHRWVDPANDVKLSLVLVDLAVERALLFLA